MPTKTTNKKPRTKGTAALPPGVKPSTLRTHPAVRRMIRDDRGVASGGSARAGSTRARRVVAPAKS